MRATKTKVKVTVKQATKGKQNRILAKMNTAYKRNSVIAQKIVKELDRQGAHVRIYTSSEGLRFEPLDTRSAWILALLLKEKPIKRLKSGISKR